MTFELFIPISCPLQVPSTMQNAKSVLQELLHIAKVDDFNFETMEQGAITLQPKLVLDEHSGLVLVNFKGKCVTELFVVDLTESPSPKRVVACVSLNYRSKMNPVIAAVT